MNADDFQKDYPWDYQGMVFCPGRWYDRTGSIALPVCGQYPFGADITYCIWRFEDKPDEWIATWRIRRYAGHNSDAFTGGDTKSWMVNRWTEPRKLRQMFVEMAGMAAHALNGGSPVTHEIIELNGDSDVLFRVIQEAKPSWMHMQIQLPK